MASAAATVCTSLTTNSCPAPAGTILGPTAGGTSCCRSTTCAVDLRRNRFGTSNLTAGTSPEEGTKELDGNC